MFPETYCWLSKLLPLLRENAMPLDRNRQGEHNETREQLQDTLCWRQHSTHSITPGVRRERRIE